MTATRAGRVVWRVRGHFRRFRAAKGPPAAGGCPLCGGPVPGRSREDTRGRPPELHPRETGEWEDRRA